MPMAVDKSSHLFFIGDAPSTHLSAREQRLSRHRYEKGAQPDGQSQSHVRESHALTNSTTKETSLGSRLLRPVDHVGACDVKPWLQDEKVLLALRT